MGSYLSKLKVSTTVTVSNGSNGTHNYDNVVKPSSPSDSINEGGTGGANNNNNNDIMGAQIQQQSQQTQQQVTVQLQQSVQSQTQNLGLIGNLSQQQQVDLNNNGQATVSFQGTTSTSSNFPLTYTVELAQQVNEPRAYDQRLGNRLLVIWRNTLFVRYWTSLKTAMRTICNRTNLTLLYNFFWSLEEFTTVSHYAGISNNPQYQQELELEKQALTQIDMVTVLRTHVRRKQETLDYYAAPNYISNSDNMGPMSSTTFGQSVSLNVTNSLNQSNSQSIQFNRGTGTMANVSIQNRMGQTQSESQYARGTNAASNKYISFRHQSWEGNTNSNTQTLCQSPSIERYTNVSSGSTNTNGNAEDLDSTNLQQIQNDNQVPSINRIEFSPESPHIQEHAANSCSVEGPDQNVNITVIPEAQNDPGSLRDQNQTQNIKLTKSNLENVVASAGSDNTNGTNTRQIGLDNLSDSRAISGSSLRSANTLSGIAIGLESSDNFLMDKNNLSKNISSQSGGNSKSGGSISQLSSQSLSQQGQQQQSPHAKQNLQGAIQNTPILQMPNQNQNNISDNHSQYQQVQQQNQPQQQQHHHQLIHRLTNMPWRLCLAIDIGATRTKFKLVDKNGDVVAMIPKVDSPEIWETQYPAISFREYLLRSLGQLGLSQQNGLSNYTMGNNNLNNSNNNLSLTNSNQQSSLSQNSLMNFMQQTFTNYGVNGSLTISTNSNSSQSQNQDSNNSSNNSNGNNHNLNQILESIDRMIFSVPGTLDISQAVYHDELTVVKNMPSFSSKFRGFDFKQVFRSYFPNAKISAVCDNLAASIGCAARHPNVANGLVLVLGTAPAVSTFFRKKDSCLETGIWQSWVWFSKIPLNDRYGYVGGVKVQDNGKKISLNPPDFIKMPHKQSRIRFALDNNTWLRLRGKHKTLKKEYQGSLSVEEATQVWVERLKSSLQALLRKFHAFYGVPDCVFLLGGNSLQCHGRIHDICYSNPEALDVDVEVQMNSVGVGTNSWSQTSNSSSVVTKSQTDSVPGGSGITSTSIGTQGQTQKVSQTSQISGATINSNQSQQTQSSQLSSSNGQTIRVPVITYKNDQDQQDITMVGLLQSSRFRVKQVYSSGTDPLDRGWTRGGEIYHWIPRRENNYSVQSTTTRQYQQYQESGGRSPSSMYNHVNQNRYNQHSKFNTQAGQAHASSNQNLNQQTTQNSYSTNTNTSQQQHQQSNTVTNPNQESDLNDNYNYSSSSSMGLVPGSTEVPRYPTTFSVYGNMELPAHERDSAQSQQMQPQSQKLQSQQTLQSQSSQREGDEISLDERELIERGLVQKQTYSGVLDDPAAQYLAKEQQMRLKNQNHHQTNNQQYSISYDERSQSQPASKLVDSNSFPHSDSGPPCSSTNKDHSQNYIENTLDPLSLTAPPITQYQEENQSAVVVTNDNVNNVNMIQTRESNMQSQHSGPGSSDSSNKSNSSSSLASMSSAPKNLGSGGKQQEQGQNNGKQG